MKSLSDSGPGKIVAVIVTRNRKPLLEKCLEAILGQTKKCDVLVIDNCSSDGTEEFIRNFPIQKGKILSCVKIGANTGGAGGFYYGSRMAVSSGYQYIWLMDDDCQPESDALEKLLEADTYLSGNYGWLSSIALWQDRTLCAMNIQRKTPYTAVDLSSSADGVIPAVMASFVSLFVKADTVRKYGFPIKDFFIWGDDWEFTRRISMHERSYVVTDSKVIHLMQTNATVNIARDRDDRLDRYRYAYRNDVFLYRREGWKGWLWLLAKDIWHSVQVLFHSGQRKRKLSIIWKNFLAGIRFSPEIEYPSSEVLDE